MSKPAKRIVRTVTKPALRFLGLNMSAPRQEPAQVMSMPEIPEMPTINIDWSKLPATPTPVVKPVAPDAAEAARSIGDVTRGRTGAVTRQSTILTGPSGSTGTVKRRKLLGVQSSSSEAILGG